MARRKYNVRRLKATLTYTVQELADLFGIHKNVPSRWMKDGLPADRTQRPFLIRGDHAAHFIATRQQARRKKCGDAQFYCFRCREPRAAYLRIVDLAVESRTRLRVKAHCAFCGTTVNKVQSASKLPKIRELFEIQQLTGAHLLEQRDTSVNGD